MEFLNDYVVLAVLGICLCVGYIIKNLIPTDKINRFIPLIVGVLGVFINIWMNGFTINAEILLGGLFSGLASTGLHQAFTQIINKSGKEE